MHQLLQNTNGGRWPIIGLDFGNKPVIDFNKYKPDMEKTTPSHIPSIPLPENEGLQDDKTNPYLYQQQTIPE
jgi:hypothetical protein